MTILSNQEREIVAWSKRFGESSMTQAALAAVIISARPDWAESLGTYDSTLSALVGMASSRAGTMARLVEELAAEVDRQRARADQAEARADQAEQRCAEMVALADDAIVALADDSAAWGARS